MQIGTKVTGTMHGVPFAGTVSAVYSSNGQTLVNVECTDGFTHTCREDRLTADDADNVVSTKGGETHLRMPGTGDRFFPLCRTGNMTNRGTKYRHTGSAITCATCISYGN